LPLTLFCGARDSTPRHGHLIHLNNWHGVDKEFIGFL
jgi:hypothetical protein